MKDVAREAGVALGTVSKVFNGIPVGERYRMKVEQAAERLGYQVNQYARGLKTNQTFIVAVVLPCIDLPFFSRLEQYLYHALMRRGYRMQLYLTDFDPETEAQCMRTIRQHKVDGIICLPCGGVAEADLNAPLVTIDHCIRPDVPCVSSDNYGGGRMQAEKLIALGCRSLAFLHTVTANYGEVDKRGDGFEMACRTNKIPFDRCWVSERDNELSFREFFRKHMTDHGLDIDGIGCSTDLAAFQAQKVLNSMGFSVPEDIQIIGYDGNRKLSTEELFCSTIVQPMERMAETSVSLLLDQGEAQSASLICLPVTYAPGGTTKE